MTLDMRQAIGYLSAVMTCAAVWLAAGSAGSARAGCNPAPGEVCCETDVTEECEEPAKVLLNGCSGMCEALPPGPGGEVALASSVDFTTEAGVKRVHYDRHGVADDCSEFPNGTPVSAVLTVLPPMTLSFSPAMLGLDRTDDGEEYKEGAATVSASVCPDAEPFYTWAPKAGVCGIPPGQPTEGASLTAVTYRTPDKEQCSSSYMDQTVSVDVSPRGSVSSNLFTVVKLDVTVGGVAEADEETAGSFVPYEADTNGTLSVHGIAALKPVAIECSPDDLPDSETVTVAAPAESLFEKIGDQYVPAQSEYKACEIGDKQFFLHGHAASGALRDLEVEITHANSGAKDKAKFTVVKVDTIDVTSTEAGSSGNPPPFEGHKSWPFDVTKSPNPDKHMVVFYKDVVDSSFNVDDFDVDLEASVLPSSITHDQLNENWSKIDGPDSGSLNQTDTFEVKYQSPKLGGVYRFDLDLGGGAKSEANVVLPLAGADVDSIVSSDIGRANTFAITIRANYSWIARQNPLNGNRWFVANGAGDYLGRPNNGSSPTVWAYNQVDFDGFGAVGTWKGKPVRVAKISNFMVGYGARRIGVSSAAAWVSQAIGTWNDSSSSKSWDAGWSVGGGASYDATVTALVADIWDEDIDPNHKNMRLWPNTRATDNYIAPDNFFDPNHQFTSPGFLYMTNP